jgi:UDP-N-acetylglucosamine acyltransferase
MTIHPTAIVDSEARLSENVSIGPYAVVEADVEVGEGTAIGAHAVLKTGLRLGKRVTVNEAAVLGGLPQDLKFSGARSYAVVEDGATIREFATIHRSAHEDGVTRVGRNCFIMSYGHVAHDCDIGEDAIVASYSALAGHIRIGRKAFVSGGAVIHQFTRVGELAMVGGCSKVNLDVPPFVIVDGVPARVVGLNTVGLRRDGVSTEEVRTLKRAYRALFREKRPLEQALSHLDGLDGELAAKMAAFFRGSERGVCRARTAKG